VVAWLKACGTEHLDVFIGGYAHIIVETEGHVVAEFVVEACHESPDSVAVAQHAQEISGGKPHEPTIEVEQQAFADSCGFEQPEPLGCGCDSGKCLPRGGYDSERMM
jgi:hypothetical protein